MAPGLIAVKASGLPATGGAMFKTILVAADDSETAARAVSTAVELVKAIGGTLHVMTAYRPLATRAEQLPDEYMDKVTDPADLLLANLRDKILERGGRGPVPPCRRGPGRGHCGGGGPRRRRPHRCRQQGHEGYAPCAW